MSSAGLRLGARGLASAGLLTIGLAVAPAASSPAGAATVKLPSGVRVYTGYADCPNGPSACSASWVSNPNYPAPWYRIGSVTFVADPNVVDTNIDHDPDTSAVRIDNSGPDAVTVDDLSVTCSSGTFDLWGTSPYSYPYTLSPGTKFVFSSTNGDNFDGSESCTGATVNVNIGGHTFSFADDVANSGAGAIHGFPGFDESTPWTLVGGSKTGIHTGRPVVPGGQVGTAYNQFVSAEDSNGAPSFSLAAGSLPPGLTLSSGPNEADETISGTPTAPGSYAFTLGVTDSNGDHGAFNYTIVIGATKVGLSASPDPATVGQQVTYTAKVKPNPGGGTVAFDDAGSPIAHCSAVPVNATSGRAKCRVTYSQPGNHSISASYSGDSNFLPSTKNPTLIETVN